MHSAVTMSKPLRITAVNTECIWQLTFTQKHLSVTSTSCHIDTHTLARSFKPIPCLFFFFSIHPTSTNLHLSHVHKYIHLHRDQGDTALFLLSWVLFYRRQAQRVVILIPQIWGIVICQSVLWNSAAGWTVCHVRCDGKASPLCLTRGDLSDVIR